MSDNGHGKIEIDLNRITRKGLRRWLDALEKARAESNGELQDELTGGFIEQVITAWPYSQPITKEGYLELGALDAMHVDQLINETLSNVGEKKA